MASNYTINVSNCGLQPAAWFTAAAFNNTVLSRFSPLAGVKNTITLPRMTVSDIVKSGNGCSWDPSGSVTVDPRSVTVCDMELQYELCYSDIESGAYAFELRQGALSAPLGTSQTNYMLGLMADGINQSVNNIAWNGDTGLTSGILASCDGYLKILGASGSGAIAVTGASGGLTTSNIIAEVGKVYLAIPAAVRSAGNIAIMVSPTAAALYRMALANLTNFSPVGSKELDYLGVPIIEVNYLPTNTMIGGNPLNFWYAFDAPSDETTIGANDQLATIGKRAVNFFTYFKIGFQIAIPSEVVYYR